MHRPPQARAASLSPAPPPMGAPWDSDMPSPQKELPSFTPRAVPQEQLHGLPGLHFFQALPLSARSASSICKPSLSLDDLQPRSSSAKLTDSSREPQPWLESVRPATCFTPPASPERVQATETQRKPLPRSSSVRRRNLPTATGTQRPRSSGPSCPQEAEPSVPAAVAASSALRRRAGKETVLTNFMPSSACHAAAIQSFAKDVAKDAWDELAAENPYVRALCERREELQNNSMFFGGEAHSLEQQMATEREALSLMTPVSTSALGDHLDVAMAAKSLASRHASSSPDRYYEACYGLRVEDILLCSERAHPSRRHRSPYRRGTTASAGSRTRTDGDELSSESQATPNLACPLEPQSVGFGRWQPQTPCASESLPNLDIDSTRL